jgi:hypothetical protein
MGANLTSFEHHEPLFHVCHESLLRIKMFHESILKLNSQCVGN